MNRRMLIAFLLPASLTVLAACGGGSESAAATGVKLQGAGASFPAPLYNRWFKAYSAAHANFQGSAVLVASTIVAMQHRRTSASGGVIDTELISAEEATCWEHLAKITRQPRPRVRPSDRRS